MIDLTQNCLTYFKLQEISWVMVQHRRKFDSGMFSYSPYTTTLGQLFVQAQDLGGPCAAPKNLQECFETFFEKVKNISPHEMYAQQQAYLRNKINGDTKFMSDMAYKNWKAELNALFSDTYGIHLDDLPDMRFRDWFEDGLTPVEVMEDEFPDFETIQELIMG